MNKYQIVIHLVIDETVIENNHIVKNYYITDEDFLVLEKEDGIKLYFNLVNIVYYIVTNLIDNKIKPFKVPKKGK